MATATSTPSTAAPELSSVAPSALVDATDNRRIGGIDELAVSIKDLGVVEPLIATRTIVDDDGKVIRSAPKGKWLLVCGHRRKAAAAMARLKTVPALLHESMTELQRLKTVAVENLEREDITPLEEADLYSRLVAAGMKQRDLSKALGPSQPRISKRLALLKLPEKARAALDSGGINLTIAEQLGQLKDPKRVEKLIVGSHVNDYELKNALREQEEADRKAASEKEISDAGVEVVRYHDVNYSADWERCEKADATHAALSPGGWVTWVRAVDKAEQDKREREYQDKRAAERKAQEASRTPEQIAREEAYAKETAERARLNQVWGDAVSRHADHLRAVLASSKFDPKAHQTLVTAYLLHGSVNYIELEQDYACELLGLTPADWTEQAERLGEEATYLALRYCAGQSDRSALKVAAALVLVDLRGVVRSATGGTTYQRSFGYGESSSRELFECYYSYLETTGYKPSKNEVVELEKLRGFWATDAAERDASQADQDVADAEAQRDAELATVDALDLKPGDEVLDDGTVVYSPDHEPWEGYADLDEQSALEALASAVDEPMSLMSLPVLRRLVAWETAHENRAAVVDAAGELERLQMAPETEAVPA